MTDKKRPLRHTVEELGEMADTHHEGGFYLWQEPDEMRGINSPDDKKWGCKLGDYGPSHYGTCPDEAVQEALNDHDTRQNPDRC